MFALPDPFVIVTVDSDQTHTTQAVKKTLTPYWGEEFELYVFFFFFFFLFFFSFFFFFFSLFFLSPIPSYFLAAM